MVKKQVLKYSKETMAYHSMAGCGKPMTSHSSCTILPRVTVISSSSCGKRGARWPSGIASANPKATDWVNGEHANTVKCFSLLLSVMIMRIKQKILPSIILCLPRIFRSQELQACPKGLTARHLHSPASSGVPLWIVRWQTFLSCSMT